MVEKAFNDAIDKILFVYVTVELVKGLNTNVHTAANEARNILVRAKNMQNT